MLTQHNVCLIQTCDRLNVSCDDTRSIISSKVIFISERMLLSCLPMDYFLYLLRINDYSFSALTQNLDENTNCSRSSQQESPFGKCSHKLKCIVDTSQESSYLPRTRSGNVSLSLASGLIKSAWVLCDCLSVFIGGACQKVVSTAVMAPQCSALHRKPRAGLERLL